MTETCGAPAPSPDDRFLERLRAIDRIEAPAIPGPAWQRLHAGVRARLDSPPRTKRRYALFAVAACAIVAAGGLAIGLRDREPAATRADDLADRQLLEKVRACRGVPDVAGLRSAFIAGLAVEEAGQIRLATPSASQPEARPPTTPTSSGENRS